MRLVDLHPEWIDYRDRRGVGVVFDCMTGANCQCKGAGRLWIFFANPVDGGPALEGDSCAFIWDITTDGGADPTTTWDRGCGTFRWHRIGETFESLSMSPSVDAHACGHKTLSDGVFA